LSSRRSRRGPAWRGGAWPGQARQDKARISFEGERKRNWRGTARPGAARHGVAGLGKARQGFSPDKAPGCNAGRGSDDG